MGAWLRLRHCDGRLFQALFRGASPFTEAAGKTILAARGPINATKAERQTLANNFASMRKGFGGAFDRLEEHPNRLGMARRQGLFGRNDVTLLLRVPLHVDAHFGKLALEVFDFLFCLHFRGG